MKRKKKSLYEIAVEKKEEIGNSTNENEKIVVLEKVSILKTLIDIIVKIIRKIFFMILSVLVTIGSTVLINESLRQQFVESVKFSIGII